MPDRLLRGLTAAALLTCSLPVEAAQRLVALTSDVSEILIALGKAPEVVGRDRASRMPEIAQAVDIGSSRALSPEPVLRVRPTLVLGTDLAQPPTIFKQLEALGVRTVKLGERPDGSDYADIIRAVGKLTQSADAADKLASAWRRDMTPAAPSGVRVLITYEGKTVAGRNTAGDTLIRAAGGVNAAASVDGHKPVNPEALAQMQPDVIFVADHNRPVYGGLDRLKARADVASTPAGKHGKVFEMPTHALFTVNLGSPASVRSLRARF